MSDQVWAVSAASAAAAAGSDPRSRLSSSELTRVLDAMPGLVGYWDCNLRNLFANRAYSEFFGVTPAEMTGKHLLDVLDEAVYTANLPFMYAALNGEAQQFDRTLTDRAGRVRHVQASYIPDLVDGAVCGMFVCVLDITTRKEQELSLIAERGRLRDAEAVGRLGSWEMDVSTRAMTFSLGFLTLYGLDPATFSGDFREVLSCLLPGDRNEVHLAVEECISSGVPLSVRYRIAHVASGHQRWMECRGQAIYHAGRPSRLLGVVADITDRVNAEQEAATLLAVQLSAARLGQQYQALLTTVVEGVVLQGCDGTILQANPAACAILGLSTDELTGRTSMDERWHAIDESGVPLPGERHPAMVSLRDGVPVRDVTFGIVNASGDLCWIEVSSAPLFDAEGKVEGVISGFADVTARRAADAEVAASRSRYQELVEHLPGSAVFVFDRDLRLVTCGGELLTTSGRDPAQMGGRSLAELVPAADLAVLQPAYESGLAGLTSILEYRSSKTGAYFMVDIAPLEIEQGVPRGVLVVAKDVSAQRHAELELADSQEQFRLAFETAPIGMAMVDLSPSGCGDLLGTNPAMRVLTGRSAETLGSIDLASLFRPEDGRATRASIARLVTGEEQKAVLEVQLVRTDGSALWAQVTMSAVPASEVRSAHAVCLIEDVTLRKHNEQQLTHQSLHDPLTGLANRRLLRDRITHALAVSVRTNLPVGILYLDLDGFKQVNDSAGHSAGDALLIQVAERLERAVRPGDTVARMGGDEFAILGVELADLDTLRRVAMRCLDSLREPFVLPSGMHHISASIGMRLSDVHSDADQLLVEADTAMYEAKRSGKDRVALRLTG